MLQWLRTASKLHRVFILWHPERASSRCRPMLVSAAFATSHVLFLTTTFHSFYGSGQQGDLVYSPTAGAPQATTTPIYGSAYLFQGSPVNMCPYWHNQYYVDSSNVTYYIMCGSDGTGNQTYDGSLQTSYTGTSYCTIPQMKHAVSICKSLICLSSLVDLSAKLQQLRDFRLLRRYLQIYGTYNEPYYSMQLQKGQDHS